jgi:hypothetical protein
MARTNGREEMHELIERWRASGETKAAFVRANGVSRGKLEYWVGRLGAPELKVSRSPRLVPVRLVAPLGAGTAPIEIVLSGGDVVRATSDVSAEALAAVIRALRC